MNCIAASYIVIMDDLLLIVEDTGANEVEYADHLGPPLHYVRFLDHASKCICCKVGGGYIFMYRLRLNYFASFVWFTNIVTYLAYQHRSLSCLHLTASQEGSADD